MSYTHVTITLSEKQTSANYRLTRGEVSVNARYFYNTFPFPQKKHATFVKKEDLSKKGVISCRNLKLLRQKEAHKKRHEPIFQERHHTSFQLCYWDGNSENLRGANWILKQQLT